MSILIIKPHAVTTTWLTNYFTTPRTTARSASYLWHVSYS